MRVDQTRGSPTGMGGSLPDWELGRRKRVHSEEKSNKCKQCDIIYLVAQLLLKTHNGEKSNPCNRCSSSELDKGEPHRNGSVASRLGIGKGA